MKKMKQSVVWKLKQDRVGPFILFMLVGCFGGIITYGVFNPMIFDGDLPYPVAIGLATILDLWALFHLYQTIFPATFLLVTPTGLQVLSNRITRRRQQVSWQDVRSIGETTMITAHARRNRGRQVKATHKPAVVIYFTANVNLPKLRGGSYQLIGNSCKFLACELRMEATEIVDRLKQFKVNCQQGTRPAVG